MKLYRLSKGQAFVLESHPTVIYLMDHHDTTASHVWMYSREEGSVTDLSGNPVGSSERLDPCLISAFAKVALLPKCTADYLCAGLARR